MMVLYEKRPELALDGAVPHFSRLKSSRSPQRSANQGYGDGRAANKKAEALKASAVVDFGV
jgi:hypothetical protein